MGIYLTTKHNLFGVAAPGATDDRNSDYTEGSRWINTLTGVLTTAKTLLPFMSAQTLAAAAKSFDLRWQAISMKYAA